MVSSQALVAHACNSRYSGDRGQEDAVQAQPKEVGGRVCLKNTQHKTGLLEWLK
jgi:hypothetical protein